jgi:hypothetical protein
MDHPAPEIFTPTSSDERRAQLVFNALGLILGLACLVNLLIWLSASVILLFSGPLHWEKIQDLGIFVAGWWAWVSWFWLAGDFGKVPLRPIPGWVRMGVALGIGVVVFLFLATIGFALPRTFDQFVSAMLGSLVMGGAPLLFVFTAIIQRRWHRRRLATSAPCKESS